MYDRETADVGLARECKPKSRGAVLSALEMLEGSVKETADRLSAHLSRINPVLRVALAHPHCNEAEEEQSCELSERIGAIRRRVDGICGEIADANARLEL